MLNTMSNTTYGCICAGARASGVSSRASPGSPAHEHMFMYIYMHTNIYIYKYTYMNATIYICIHT